MSELAAPHVLATRLEQAGGFSVPHDVAHGEGDEQCGARDDNVGEEPDDAVVHGSSVRHAASSLKGHSPCVAWTGLRDRKGYGRVSIRLAPGKWAMRQAHRVAWERAHGPIAPGLCVCHRCDNPSCVNVEHLFLGTKADNNRDMWSKGRGRLVHHSGDAHYARLRPETVARGETHPSAKLSDVDVALIREHRAEGASLKLIARVFGVGTSQVHRIVSGQART